MNMKRSCLLQRVVKLDSFECIMIRLRSNTWNDLNSMKEPRSAMLLLPQGSFINPLSCLVKLLNMQISFFRRE